MKTPLANHLKSGIKIASLQLDSTDNMGNRKQSDSPVTKSSEFRFAGKMMMSRVTARRSLVARHRFMSLSDAIAAAHREDRKIAARTCCSLKEEEGRGDWKNREKLKGTCERSIGSTKQRRRNQRL
ncbi:hypothetical protein Dimus_009949 [Dionaea muscipula]